MNRVGAITPAQITVTASVTNPRDAVVNVAGIVVALLLGVNAASVPAAIDGNALFPGSILIAQIILV